MEIQEKIQRIKTCLGQVRYLDTPKPERMSALAGLLADAFDRKGQSASGADGLADMLDREIADYMGRQLTLREAMLAIDWGLHGEYGEYTGLNAERLFRFVRAYLESGERQEAIRAANAKRMSPQKTVNAGLENWNAMLKEFSEEVEYWRQHRTVEAVKFGSDNGRRALTGMCYQWLKTVGLVSSDADTLGLELEQMKKAEKMLRREGRSMRNVFDEVLSRSIPSPVRSYGYSLMMLAYFRNAEAAGIDLDAIVADLKKTPAEERRFFS